MCALAADRPRAPDEQAKAVIQHVAQFPTDRLSSVRSELDGQRNAVQPAAYLGDRRSRCRIEREIRLHEARAINEEPHGLERREPIGLVSGWP
jgi:hypothetical protein